MTGSSRHATKYGTDDHAFDCSCVICTNIRIREMAELREEVKRLKAHNCNLKGEVHDLTKRLYGEDQMI